MLTDFGKLCRIIRLKRNQNLGDMAEILGVKSSFLSAVENGKKNIPSRMCSEIKNKYELSKDEYVQLCEAAENSKLQIKIKMEGMKSQDRNLVLSFARKFENLDNEEKNEIMKILNKEG